MRKSILFLASSLAFSLGISQANSQDVPFRKYCATDSMTNAALDKYPQYAIGRQQFIDRVKALNNLPENARVKKNGGKYTIPIVIHVMHTYGADNITDAQIYDAVRIINEDFSKINADTASVIAPYKSLAANVEFEFKLAQKDPQGNCTNGITRTYTPLTNSADNNVKNLVRWTPSRYLNIWVVNTISFGAGGYSYLPCSVPETLEGIVILNTQFGSTGLANGSNFAARSLTHEIGHYMGLPHVWGSGNTPGASGNCGMDDGIADTPNTIGASPVGSCKLNEDSCPDSNYPFPDPNGLLPDNAQNYMDYSSCAKMFTTGQKNVMVDALFTASCRTLLADSANLVFTGTNPGYVAVPCAPSVDFTLNANRMCAGNSVRYQQHSYNLGTGNVTYEWTFPGGSPATSNDENPLVTYNIPGVYDATLKVTNAAGNSTLTKTGTITVTPGHGVAGVPFIRGFENANFPTDPNSAAESWEREVSGNTGWERITGIAATGNASIRIRNNGVSTEGKNSLITPNISLYNVTGTTLTFKVAYSQRSADFTEKLSVYVSDNCGQSWISRLTKTGASLATAPMTPGGIYTPQSASEWRQESINIPPSFSGKNMMVKFEVTSDGGHPVYLDDIEINGIVSGINENLAVNNSLNVYPNPSNGDATVSFSLPSATDFSLEVYSITGQQIGKTYMKQGQNGMQEIALSEISGTQNLKAGVYMVKLKANGFTTLKKAIVF